MFLIVLLWTAQACTVEVSPRDQGVPHRNQHAALLGYAHDEMTAAVVRELVEIMLTETGHERVVRSLDEFGSNIRDRLDHRTLRHARLVRHASAEDIELAWDEYEAVRAFDFALRDGMFAAWETIVAIA